MAFLYTGLFRQTLDVMTQELVDKVRAYVDQRVRDMENSPDPYASGKKHPSAKQAEKIENAIKQLGHQLAEVHMRIELNARPKPPPAASLLTRGLHLPVFWLAARRET